MANELTSKEKLTILAELITSKCTHEEIDMLCIALLDANLKCKLRNESKIRKNAN